MARNLGFALSNKGLIYNPSLEGSRIARLKNSGLKTNH